MYYINRLFYIHQQYSILSRARDGVRFIAPQTSSHRYRQDFLVAVVMAQCFWASAHNLSPSTELIVADISHYFSAGTVYRAFQQQQQQETKTMNSPKKLMCLLYIDR
jgi:hypothetical protein